MPTLGRLEKRLTNLLRHTTNGNSSLAKKMRSSTPCLQRGKVNNCARANFAGLSEKHSNLQLRNQCRKKQVVQNTIEEAGPTQIAVPCKAVQQRVGTKKTIIICTQLIYSRHKCTHVIKAMKTQRIRLKELLARCKLLRYHSSSSKHGQATIVQLFSLHDMKLFRISRLQV